MTASQAASPIGTSEIRRTDESDLWIHRHDPRVRAELVNRYLPFSQKLASRYRNGTESFDDLIQVASVGLLNAIDRFDPANGTAFTSFAAPTINGELKRYFRDRVWLVRVPRGVQEDIAALNHAVVDLGAQLHREPTAEEIVDSKAMSSEAVVRASRGKSERIPVSLDAPIDEDGGTRGDNVGVDDAGFRSIEDRDEIRRAVEVLSDEQKLVMRFRFIDEMTQSEIADRIGCSQMHISRVLSRAIASLVR